jgi:serralysin
MADQTNSIPGTGYGSPYIDSLIWGCGWTGGAPVAIDYFFGEGYVPLSDSSLGTDFTGAAWSGREIGAFETALDRYEAVCNVEFQPGADLAGSDIVWWLAPESAMGAGYLGMHEVPDNSWTPIYGYFNYEDPTWQYLDQGEYGFVTVIHELGHGMGLAHPHDGGDHADATVFPGVRGPWSTGKNGLNQGIWTTMSYNDGWDKLPSHSDEYGWQGTLMALDVAALQKIYGVNTATATGDDIYALPDVNGSGTYWDCIWDAEGADTISNDGSSIACTINLNEAPLAGANAGGYVSAAKGIIGGYTIAHGAVIENAVGGSGDDTLIGNAADT